MGYQAISVFTLLAQVIIKLFCSSLCTYNTILARKCQYYNLDVVRLIVKSYQMVTLFFLTFDVFSFKIQNCIN